MALTAAQFEEELRSNLGERTNLEARLIRFVNLAQERIARAFPWRELESDDTKPTVADTEAVDVSDLNFRDILSIRLDLSSSESRKLVFVPTRVWDATITDTDWYSTGKPSHYTLYAGSIRLWRVPDAIYSLALRYNTWPTTLVSGDDATASDLLNKDEIILAAATGLALRSGGEEEDARHWFQIYKAELVEATREGTVYTDEDIGGEIPGRIGQYWLDPFTKRMP